MPTIEVQLRRVSVVSSRPFEETVRRLTATIRRPDIEAFHNAVAAARTLADLKEVVHGAIGPSDRITPRDGCAVMSKRGRPLVTEVGVTAPR
jgi:hypothetical protein